MTPFISRIMLFVFSFLAVVLMLIHAQPHDDRDTLNLLMDDSCDAPCFMGIQPGLTTVSDAVKLLENHPWVQDVESRYTDFGQSANTVWGYVYWQWKPSSPLWTHKPSFTLGLHPSYLRILDGRVKEIAFSTTLPLGALVLSAGENSTYVLDHPDRYGLKPYPIFQHFYYPKLDLAFVSISTCPTINPDWHQDTVVIVWSKNDFDSFMQILPLAVPSLKQAKTIARMECR